MKNAPISSQRKIISKTGKNISAARVFPHSNPLKKHTKDILVISLPLLGIPFTKQELLNIKPSEFQKILQSRKDIPQDVSKLITMPEELGLYDCINNTIVKNKIRLGDKTKVIKRFLKNSDAKSAREIVPKLVDKGYDVELLSYLPINQLNKNVVEEVLNKKNLIKRAVRIGYSNAGINKEIRNYIKQLESLGYQEKDVKELIASFKEELHQAVKNMENMPLEIKKEHEIGIIVNILNNVDKKNIKYLEEYLQTTKDIGFNYLKFWNRDTAKIYNTYLKDSVNFISTYDNAIIFDKIFRKKHDYKSVREIYGDSPITYFNKGLLEYRNFKKYKDIDLSNFSELSTKEKKGFIDAYIKAFVPADIFKNDLAKLNSNSIYSNINLSDDFKEYSSRMKIYEHFDVSSPENLENSYIETLKKLLDALEENERNPINQRINYNIFKNFYIEKNPIPTLVDDLSKLDYKTEHYKGKDYKVIEILQENNLGLSAHSFVPNLILNIEALEIVDPKFFLSVAQKGKGNMSEQWITDKETYKLYVKPRLGNDLWLQAPINVGSGHGSLKNIHHIQTNYKNKSNVKSFFAYIPELLKKELDLSQREYTKRMKKIRNCTTLDEIKQKDNEMEAAIKKILKENEVFEGLVRPEIMAIGIPENTSLSQVNPHILSYVDRHPECRLVRIV